MRKDTKLKLLFIFLLLFLTGAGFMLALPIFASQNLGGLTLEINYPRFPGAVPPQDFLTSAPPEDILSLYVKYLVNFFIWVGGILALAGLIYGGIKYLLSTGKLEAMVSAKDQITAAFFGLLLLLSSYLILHTISPQFVELKIPTLETIQFPPKPEIPLPGITAINSSIDIEIPFGRIIEKIFETYISEYPKPEPKPEPRMLRIKNISRAIIGENDDGLADKLKKQSQDLKNAADGCSCQETKPEEPCGAYRSGNTTWKCDSGGCGATGPVTSDPCAKVRGDIQKTEEENLNVIYKGTEVIQYDENGDKKKFKTSLIEEQTKIEEEVGLLKEQLDRLKRAEKFIKECPLRNLSSLAQFYSKQDDFEKNNWVIRDKNFWDDISIRYYTGKYSQNQYGSWYYVPAKEIGTDFATFYCSVSGTMEQRPSYAVPEETKLTGEESLEEAEEVMSESIACSKEAPVGEIIDRSKRTAQLLIDKLEMLFGKIKELIDAVDKLQVLVSQCSSQRGCERRCTNFRCGCGTDPCIDRCQGWAYGCADSSPRYPGECKERDEDTPCPYQEIKDQLEEIQKIWQEIKDLIEGKDNKETPENIGILTIIDEITPQTLKDLEWKIRKPIKDCSSESWLEQDTVLFNCSQVMGAVVPPENKVARLCCQTYSWEQGQATQTSYGDCFEECYLTKETDNTNYLSDRFVSEYRKCLQKCLDDLSIKLSDPEINKCIQELNFYCCHVK